MKEEKKRKGDKKPLESLIPEDVPRGTIVTIKKFSDLIFKWNEKINLTGAKSPEDFFHHHIFDCLQAERAVRDVGPWIDVGSGSGLPGMIWAILRWDQKFFLVERSQKKSAFLRRAVDFLGLKNVVVIPQSVEEIENEDISAGLDLIPSCVSRGTFSPPKILPIIKSTKFLWKNWYVFSSEKTHQALLTEAGKFEMKVEMLSYQRDLEDPKKRGLLSQIQKTGFATGNPL